MAALVFSEHLRDEGLAESVRVTSAGIGDWHVGEPADPRAAGTLRARGYPADHVAAQVTSEHAAADLLVAADRGHMRALSSHVGDSGRTVLLRSFDPHAPQGAEIPDPYYGGNDGFPEVLEMIEAAMPELLAWVRERL